MLFSEFMARENQQGKRINVNRKWQIKRREEKPVHVNKRVLLRATCSSLERQNAKSAFFPL